MYPRLLVLDGLLELGLHLALLHLEAHDLAVELALEAPDGARELLDELLDGLGGLRRRRWFVSHVMYV